MRMSELSAKTGVAVATIKYYLREGLLPAGRLMSTTQAQYDDAHVQRLRLIRALLGPARLSIAQVRRVLDAIDAPEAGTLARLAQAQHAASVGGDVDDLGPAEAVLARAGWKFDPESAEVAQLAAALAALAEAGYEIPEENFTAYLDAAAVIAETEIAHIPTGSAEAAIRYSVLGTVLVEPVLLALRRLAQQDAAYRRFDPDGSR
ncbi:MerR family transcriptional regulator [Amycolatopsis panacis]|uniref:MerR family transcriptional regulator n=1 Tax=Amycolatopsis panacis TaxID=2340917 RepID=A0A419I8I9_9PSEU|nr:MerR family transcriptional regulator [Amycolatopsis panacis]RJQ88477.1 MerR family transcriptional regulator [Amycolatopsis panacis]